MGKDQSILLCIYNYDPLDRLTECALSKQDNTQRFYLKDRLATEIQGAIRHSVFQHDDQLLAQRTVENGFVATRVLTTDGQRSVLCGVDASGAHEHVYTPYGHRVASTGLLSLLGFNGERPDPVTGHYLLGNGYRAFNPVLMRFNSPDSMSPFGKGGVNAYGYCGGDPVNRSDPDGHSFLGVFRQVIHYSRRLFKRFFPGMSTTTTPVTTTNVARRTVANANAVNSSSEVSSMIPNSRIASRPNLENIGQVTMGQPVQRAGGRLRVQRLQMQQMQEMRELMEMMQMMRIQRNNMSQIINRASAIQRVEHIVSAYRLTPQLRNVSSEQMNAIRRMSNFGHVDSRTIGENLEFYRPR